MQPDSPGETVSSIKEYLKEIRKTPLLTFDQEIELARRISKGDEFARIKLFEANRRLVVAIGKKYIIRDLRSFADIIEIGNMGLIIAIEKYQSERGFKFSTYAAWWIKKTIEQAIAHPAGFTGFLFHSAEGKVFEEMLHADRFIDHICIVCGFKGNYIYHPYRFYACPKCLNERIKELRKVEYAVPDWIVSIEKESELRISWRIMEQEGHISFYECDNCKKAIMLDNVRYLFSPGDLLGKPYCIECYDRIRNGK